MEKIQSMINQEALEEIKKIKCRDKEYRKNVGMRFYVNGRILWVLELRDEIAIDINYGFETYFPSLSQAKQFSKDLSEIISIAEKCKVILKKYKQYEEK